MKAFHNVSGQRLEVRTPGEGIRVVKPGGRFELADEQVDQVVGVQFPREAVLAVGGTVTAPDETPIALQPSEYFVPHHVTEKLQALVTPIEPAPSDEEDEHQADDHDAPDES